MQNIDLATFAMMDPNDVAVRTEEELYRRLIALWAVTAKAKFPEEDFFLEYVVENHILDWLSPLEREFLTAKKPTAQQEISFSWRAEAIAFLCWCGGIIHDLKIGGDSTDPSPFIELFPEDYDDPGKLKRALKIRGKDELIEWSERLYDAHGKMRRAERGGPAVPEDWNLDKIMEWHHAINWMLYFIEDPQEWDEVTTDT